jgi:hypothetical protein
MKKRLLLCVLLGHALTVQAAEPHRKQVDAHHAKHAVRHHAKHAEKPVIKRAAKHTVKHAVKHAPRRHAKSPGVVSVRKVAGPVAQSAYEAKVAALAVSKSEVVTAKPEVITPVVRRIVRFPARPFIPRPALSYSHRLR